MKENNRKGGSMPTPSQANVKVTKENNPPAPVPDESPVKVDLGAKPSDSTVEIKSEDTGFMVTALRKGVYGGLRRNPGDRFKIGGKSKWGTWMKCDDDKLQAELEKKRQDEIKKIRQG